MEMKWFILGIMGIAIASSLGIAFDSYERSQCRIAAIQAHTDTGVCR